MNSEHRPFPFRSTADLPYQSFRFEHALKQQPQTFPESLLLKVFAAALFVAGQILVISSTWALGVTGELTFRR